MHGSTHGSGSCLCLLGTRLAPFPVSPSGGCGETVVAAVAGALDVLAVGSMVLLATRVGVTGVSVGGGCEFVSAVASSVASVNQHNSQGCIVRLLKKLPFLPSLLEIADRGRFIPRCRSISAIQNVVLVISQVCYYPCLSRSRMHG